MQQTLGLRGREAFDALDLAAHHVVAERDLAEQLAAVGELDGPVDGRVHLGFADVVQSAPVTASSRSIGRERTGRQGAHALRHRQAVLDQPVAVGLVVVLGRGAVW